jgi:UDP-N-acetylmuramoyl-L-alanyl-D-glutamate--2,6-diaminopimelate ligase
VRLSALAAAVPHERLGPPSDPEVTGLTHDSRAIRPGDLFAAFDGLVHDGRRFLPDAVARGAVAALGLVPDPPAPEVPYLAVAHPRRAGGLLAAELWRHPSRSLVMAGITGTSGKTTTSLLVDRVLAARHPRRGLFGTLVYRGAGGDARALEAARTTPEATDLQPMLAALLSEGGSAATMECSSHALSLERLAGCVFDVAVFLNLSRDHLDFHRDMEDYLEAKAKLFSLLKPGGTAVVNVGDASGRALAARLRDGRLLTFSLDGEADVTAEADCGVAGTRLVVRWGALGDGRSFQVDSPLLGRPNAENLLAAAATGLALGLPQDEIAASLASLDSVPGRLERVPNGLGLTVLVDYAHKPGALEGVLRTARSLAGPGGRVLSVFGCGGERDRGKRPEMGRISVTLADETIVTSDNPRGEVPESILDDIRRGIEPTGRPATFLVDRREAISLALRLARRGDVVVVAGKGHETYQQVGATKHPFDDRLVARRLLEEMAGA